MGKNRNPQNPPKNTSPQQLSRQNQQADLDRQAGSATPMVRQETSMVYAEMYSGPLPPAEDLVAYDRVVPGAALIIVQEMVKQGDHRRAMEAMYLRGSTTRAARGQHYALTIALACLILAGAALAFGYPTIAVTIVGIDLIGLAGLFLTGTISRKKERERKAEISRPD